MSKILQRLLLVFIIGVTPLVTHAASIRYSYEGQELVTSGGLPLTTFGPEGLTDISGFMEFVQALAPNLSAASVAGISSYEFFDGVTIYDDSNSYVETIQVSTDVSGNLTGWLLTLPQLVPGTVDDEPISMTISSYNREDADSPLFDAVLYSAGVAHIGTETVPVAVNLRSTSAGQWSAAVVPVPATAWLFGSTLGLLGWMTRKRA